MTYTLLYPPRNPVTTSPASVGIEAWEEVTFTSVVRAAGIPTERVGKTGASAGNLQLKGWFIPPNKEVNDATLIFVHGWQGNRTALLNRAAVLHQHGYGAFLIDLRNSGESEGNISTWGYAEADDVQAAYEYLLTRSEVNPAKIGAMGFSTGGAAVSKAAARIPGLKVVMIESTYISLVDNLANIVGLMGGRIPAYPPLVLWLMEWETGLPLQNIRPIEEVADIAPRPLMFLQGDKDIVVHPNHSQRLFEAASEPKKLYMASSAGHGEVFSSNPEEFEKQVVSFLDAYLR